MSIEIKVPVLPESVADALLLDWTRKVGDHVQRDEIIVEVETDKVVLEVPAPADGVITEILANSGDTVLGDQLLARIEAGAAPAGNADAHSVVDDGQSAEDSGADSLGPAARRLVAEYGIDPSVIKGTGKDGRLTKEDVLNHIASQVVPEQETPSTAQPAPVPAPDKPARAPMVKSGEREEIREPMSRLRQTIAHRLLQSQQGAALLTTFNEVNMQPVMDLRSKYKDDFEKKHGTRLGFMSFFVRASVVALQRYPLVNAYIDGTDIVKHSYHDIGIAVSSPRGLVVPVLRDCADMSFADVESQIREFGGKAKDGKISLEDLSGGTFTITNGGVFGSLLSTPIVNPPQSAILGMHKIQDRPMAENGEVVIRPMMYLALSYDHRIIDGKEAVQFLVTIKDILEDPARLLLDC
ncbi:MAG: 2-oxoglutarate dehydrogenase complex dihydrolipoyllysine-residue succinyltransferase [Gammaproteobacteria bacterium]|nr:2-oxoglutarate dehydrogenase complex dihydrolipoyllysine-residue succinyltransferase [Gammaproteobacteria bacterium]